MYNYYYYFKFNFSFGLYYIYGKEAAAKTLPNR